MPDLTESTDDIKPAVLQLRNAARIMPNLVICYFAIQFAVAGSLWGVVGCIVGAGCGWALGALLAGLVAPIYAWLIHTLFLFHGIRENLKRLDKSAEYDRD